MKNFLFISVVLAALSPDAFAHPVSYKGAVGVMSWNQPYLSDHWITYSFRPDAAFAARIMRFDAPEGRMQYFLRK